MISVDEAKQIINESVKPLPPAKLFLHEAWDTTLAEDIYALQDIPAFAQSSMDGYAFAFSDLQYQQELYINGESAAGNNKKFALDKKSAARIFTGAPVPEGADTVVMQEKVKVDKGHLTVEDESLLKGSNVRGKGSEIKKGELALARGSYLGAAAVGFLAGIGVTHVTVYPKPLIGIIVTGNELKPPGEPLSYGEVYESNSYALTAALKQFYLTPFKIWHAEDDPAVLRQIIKDGLAACDILLLTGGVSVGDYDFVKGTATECGVSTLFHKIKQRPGKPLYFGMAEEKLVFGLPGNPSSVLTCFYEYVVPAIKIMTLGKQMIRVLKAPLAETFIKNTPFTQFLKGYYDGGTVTPLTGQESYKMNSFARSNCLIILNEGTGECRKGETTEIHLITG